MCGIAGFWTQGRGDESDVLRRMTARLAHRGPDGQGTWGRAEDGIWLGHRRLSVLDTSSAGSQPMLSPSGRYVITYNGEVYNHAELRRALPAGVASSWRGESDTETLLAAIEHWGLERTVERCVGMFAFALWDSERRALHLVRDRLGKKPLYYGRSGGTVLFGSELKALRQHPSFVGEVEPAALRLYLRLGFVPSPLCIYRGFSKLPAGCILSLREPQDSAAEPRSYWDVVTSLERARRSPFRGDDQAAAEELDRLLRDAVRLRMISDVPIGALLSGGVDSSLVVAMMQTQRSEPVRTFSIGFEEGAYDEAVDARKVAQHLSTAHTELYVSARDALDVIPSLPDICDEPFADASVIPTYLISRLARAHVTVALTGDGGDEVWGGYDRYVWGRRVWSVMTRLPRRARIAFARALASVSPDTWDSVAARLERVIPSGLRVRLPGHKVHKLLPLARAQSMEDFHRELASLAWRDPDQLLTDGGEPARPTRGRGWPSGLDIAELMMLEDLRLGFPDDMLTKVDRASMASSLEARVPLADHRLLEFAWSLPLSMKIRDRRGKWLLRQVLHRYVPRELVERPKMGFGVPLDRWLRGPLRDWAEDLLHPAALEGAGLRSAPIRRALEEHLDGRGSRHVELWTILMLQAWRRRLQPESRGGT